METRKTTRTIPKDEPIYYGADGKVQSFVEIENAAINSIESAIDAKGVERHTIKVYFHYDNWKDAVQRVWEIHAEMSKQGGEVCP